MRLHAMPLLLLAAALGCGRGGEGGAADTAAPDTAAIRGAESAPHPTPSRADSIADSTAAARAGRRP